MSGQDDVKDSRVNLKHTILESDGQREVTIPWTMAVLMDGSGNHPEGKRNSIDDAEFETVDAASFESYLREASPRLSLEVPNKISGDENEKLAIDMTIKSMKDFTPDSIAQSVPGLKEVYETRQKLESLLRTLNTSRSARKILNEALDSENSGQLANILAAVADQVELGSDEAADESEQKS